MKPLSGCCLKVLFHDIFHIFGIFNHLHRSTSLRQRDSVSSKTLGSLNSQIHPRGLFIHHQFIIELHFFIRYILQQISKTTSSRFQFHRKHSPARSNPRHALETGLSQQCPAPGLTPREVQSGQGKKVTRYQTATALRGRTQGKRCTVST